MLLSKFTILILDVLLELLNILLWVRLRFFIFFIQCFYPESEILFDLVESSIDLFLANFRLIEHLAQSSCFASHRVIVSILTEAIVWVVLSELGISSC